MAQLPSEIHEQLRRAVFNIFEKAWDALRPGSSTPTAVEDVMLSSAREAVLTAARQTYAAMAQAARLENGRSSWLKRLPNELWCHIWEHLPFVDRLSATHVCAYWRESIPALPHLWTDLRLYAYSVRPGCTPPLRALRQTLALSRDLPLDVTVEMGSGPPDWTTLVGLTRALEPHSARIARLCIRAGQVDVPGALLCRLGALSALRVLVVERLPGTREGKYLTFGFWAAPATELPALERITLGSGFTFDPPPSERRLPSVRVLDLTPRENSSVEVGAALACCTQLDTLRLDMRAPDKKAYADWPSVELCADTSRVASVTISVLCRSNEIWAMRAFSEAAGRRELVLEYPRSHATPLSLLGWYILGDLLTKEPADAVDVIVAYDTRKKFSVHATASDGRLRSVTVVSCLDPCVFMNRIADILGSAQCKLKVTIDASLRDHVSNACSTSAAPDAELALETMERYQ